MGWRDLFSRKGQTVPQLRKEVAHLQHSLSILLSGIEERQSSTAGNPYRESMQQIKALSDKYEGKAEWGVQQTQNIIDVRSAFIIGAGIRVKDAQERETKTREVEFIEKFIEHNDMDEEMPQEFAKEAEIEGRFLCRLIPNKEVGNIDLRWVSYTTNSYTVEAAPNDYRKYERVVWKDPKAGNGEIILKSHEFVYKRFAGRLNMVNDISPKVAKVLRLVEDLDKALVDLRHINHLFAAPTPYFETDDSTKAKTLYEKLKEINWKIGKLLVGTAKFELKGADVAGIEALIKEIVSYMKVISGATGIPVHFLGLPDLMSNRSTSTDLFELIEASTSKERKIWIGGYEEIFKKAMMMANDHLQAGLNPDKNMVTVDIPKLTSAKLQELTTVWLPLFTNNVIDLDTILAKIPDAEANKIKKNLEAEAQKVIEDMRAQEEETDNNE